MTVLVVGASGATGRLLVNELLMSGEKVKIIVRDVDALPDSIKFNDRLMITEADLLTLSDEELMEQVTGCRAVASCLGHNLTFKGIYGHPRRLVTDATKRLTNAIEKIIVKGAKPPVKFLLMNTTGNQNRQAGEKIPLSQYLVVGLIRFLIPPHSDNEKAAAYLQSNYHEGHEKIEWSVIRPDTLINDGLMTDYDIYESPIRNPIFDAGTTSRINVAAFMSQLIIKERLWDKWKGKMPVIYNRNNT